MLVCPNCHSEYREGYYKCSDCNVELIAKTHGNNFNEVNSLHGDKWIFLYNIREEFKAINAKSLLEDNNIPVLIKSKGSGEYLKLVQGISFYGFDLYVHREKAEEAKEILESILKDNDETMPLDEEDKIEAIKYEKRKRLRIWILLLIFWGPGLLFLLVSIFKQILKIFK